jgi:hypothetical protein
MHGRLCKTGEVDVKRSLETAAADTYACWNDALRALVQRAPPGPRLRPELPSERRPQGDGFASGRNPGRTDREARNPYLLWIAGGWRRCSPTPMKADPKGVAGEDCPFRRWPRSPWTISIEKA